jgi:hypothetical protein
MKIIPFHDLTVSRWKNGCGATRELAVHPPGASFESLDWRASVADIEASGPFSEFAGLDRVILLIDGDGIRMDFGDGDAHALTQLFEPHAFHGEQPVLAHLVGGPSRDFNVMLRRGVVSGSVRVWRAAAVFDCLAGHLLCFCARGAWELTLPDGERYPIAFQDTLVGESPPGRLELQPMAEDSVLFSFSVCDLKSLR